VNFAAASHDPVAIALAEDIGSGDITSQCFVDPARSGVAHIVAREAAVVAGSDAARRAFELVDSDLEISVRTPDGTRAVAGAVAMEIEGRAASILTAERVALNFLQRLSGVATATAKFADAIAGSGVRLLDTRKTTPGLRALEKAAVRAGGGHNHRFGLHDMFLIKDNHLAAGTDPAELERLIRAAREQFPDVKVEIEADTVEQVAMFAKWPGVSVILLDNMSLEELRASVRHRRPGLQFEASGGVSLENIAEIARTGVDFISVGAITHSARAIDFGLDLIR
jgi:nicotinate-nucleotide pyrophosphorylase (carboxylating)